jgi:uncharacterized surface protein with fasciclin (FAS1) repeats
MNSKKKLSTFFTAMYALLLTAALNLAAAQSGDVVDVINESEDHTVFAQMLADTELDNVISQQGPFTVVAPTDDAFAALGDDLEQIQADPERMQNIVIGHLFQGEVPATDVETTLEIEISEGDIPATNGLIHVVDEVIMN